MHAPSVLTNLIKGSERERERERKEDDCCEQSPSKTTQTTPKAEGQEEQETRRVTCREKKMQPGACERKIRIEHELVKAREEETRRSRGRRCRVRGWKEKKKKKKNVDTQEVGKISQEDKQLFGSGSS